MERRSISGPVVVATVTLSAAIVNLGNVLGWWDLTDAAASSVNVVIYSVFGLLAAIHAAAEPVQAMKRKNGDTPAAGVPEVHP